MIFLDDPRIIGNDEAQLKGIPLIYSTRTLEVESVPSEFNAVSIPLDGKISSDLKWKTAADVAHSYLKKGLGLFWEIDLGLFSTLHFPLSDETQYLALCFALRHFRDTIWKEFHDQSIGISFYRGPIDFSETLTWNAELEANFDVWLKIHCPVIISNRDHLCQTNEGQWVLSLYFRDVALEFLKLLAQQLPANLWPSLLFETENVHEPLRLAQLLSKEKFDRFHRAISVGGLPSYALTIHPGGIIAEETHTLNAPYEIKLGVCVPEMGTIDLDANAKMNSVLEAIESKEKPFRLVSEAMLTTEWDGLDDLIVFSEHVSMQGRRKLQGFCAAGGRVVTVGSRLNLPNEIAFTEGPYGP